MNDLTTILINAANAQALADEQRQAMIFLSIAIGLACGLIPGLLGLMRRQFSYALFGFVACIVGGYILGWILAIPLCVVFTSMINAKANKIEADEREHNERHRQTLEQQRHQALERQKQAAATLRASEPPPLPESKKPRIITFQSGTGLNTIHLPAGILRVSHKTDGYNFQIAQSEDSVTISSFPSDVQIMLNDLVHEGETPATFQLKPGTYEIKAKSDDKNVLAAVLEIKGPPASIDSSGIRLEAQ